MSVVAQLYFQIVEENHMFRPFSGWAIIRLRLEYRGKTHILQCGHPEWGNEISFYVWEVCKRDVESAMVTTN
jgi:hypothetical protein